MAGKQARTLTVSVESDQETWRKLHEAARRIDAGEGYQGEFHAFATLPQMLKVFSIKRWELMTTLQALGPSSLRALARTLGRDVKRVHEDAQMLLEEGVLERDEQGKLLVPFEHIRLEADFRANVQRPAA